MMTKRPDQYTTEPNNMPAPIWAGEGLYWNPAYLKHIEKRDALEAHRSPTAEAPERVTADQWNGGYGRTIKEERICAVKSCQKPFIPKGPKQRTCGSEECRKKRKSETTSEWFRRSKKAVA